MRGLILGVDGGGTKTAVWLANTAGDILGRGVSSPSNYQVVGKTAALHAIQNALLQAYQQAGLPPEPAKIISLGMAGVGRDEDRSWLVDWCKGQNIAEKLEIMTDAELLLWAGTPDGWGIGCISGTGSISFGIDPLGKKARAGGWGYILGDEGSGYAIGISALRAVTQAADGRGPQTGLTTRVLAAWNLSEPAALISAVYRSNMAREQIGALTEWVLKEAEAGDEVAVHLVNTAAADLSLAIGSVARQLNWGGTVPGAMGGGVLVHSPYLVQKVIHSTQQVGINLEPVQIVDEPVVGAIRYAVRCLS